MVNQVAGGFSLLGTIYHEIYNQLLIETSYTFYFSYVQSSIYTCICIQEKNISLSSHYVYILLLGAYNARMGEYSRRDAAIVLLQRCYKSSRTL